MQFPYSISPRNDPRNHLRRHLTTAATALLLMGTLAAHSAQAALINISLNNTSQLPANTGFLLQYTNSNGVVNNNSVSASNFSGLTGTGSPDTSLGSASGDLSGNPSNPTVGDAGNGRSNEFFQNFTATANTISFDLNTTVSSIGQSPDSFSFQLYQPDNSAPFATNAPDGQSLFTLTFDSLSNPTINGGQGNFSTNDPSLTGGQITATVRAAPVPEPGTYAMMALGLGALGLVTRKRKRDGAQNSTAFAGVAI